MSPRVSVIVPVFNGAATVGRALDSALAQLFADPFEVVVVDDGSTDATPRVLDGYASRIKVVSEGNRGLAGARNAGASASKGEYLAFLDADDVWLPDKLAATVGALEYNRGAVLAYSDAIAVDDAGTVQAPSFVPPELAHPPSMDDLLRRWWPMLPSSVVIRRRTFDECGGFCEEFRQAYEDLDMWIRARERGAFEYVSRPLLRYRITPIVERMEKYERDYPVFVRRLKERYGVAARPLLAATRRAYTSALGYKGLTAMRRGDLKQARRSFLRALSHEPLNLRTSLRLLRTFLPRPLARALSGRTQR